MCYTKTLFNLLTLSFFILQSSCKTSDNKPLSFQPVDSLAAGMKDTVQAFTSKQEFTAAHHYLDSIRGMVAGSKEPSLLSTWYRLKGSTFMYDNKFDSANRYLKESHRIAAQIVPPGKYLIQSKVYLMDLFGRMGKFDSSLRYGLDAYKLCPQKDSTLYGNICEKLAESYIRMGDTSSTRRYLFEGYAYSKGNPDLQFVLSMNIAGYYFQIGRMDSALIFHKRMMTLDIYKQNVYYQATSKTNMGTMLLMGGKLDDGIKYLKEAASLIRQYDLPSNYIYLNLSEAYNRKHNYNEAKLYADTAVFAAKEKGNYTDISNAFMTLSDNLIAGNRHKEAYKALDSSYYYYAKNDSISYIKKAQELETQYAVRSKDEKITSLSFENKANLKIRNQQKTIIITLVLATLLIAIIGILLWRRRQMRIKFREVSLQQQLLRTQMEPHFIYNALNVLLGFIRNSEVKKAVKYVTSFGRLLRLSLENASESFVPLKNEIDALESYLSLQAISLEGKFDYKIDVKEEYLKDNILIPPMLLQPFAENAIIHGISKIDDKGFIMVTVRKNEHVLHCQIEDNGPGLSTSAHGRERRSTSTIITKERLAILGRQTGHPASVAIRNISGENPPGVVVSLDIPFLMTTGGAERYQSRFYGRLARLLNGEKEPVL